MSDSLTDKIYEAAFQPECWHQVLQDVGQMVQSPAGVIFVFDDIRPIQYRSTEIIKDIAHQSVEHWQDSPRVGYYQKRPFFGFAVMNTLFPSGNTGG